MRLDSVLKEIAKDSYKIDFINDDPLIAFEEGKETAYRIVEGYLSKEKEE